MNSEGEEKAIVSGKEKGTVRGKRDKREIR